MVPLSRNLNLGIAILSYCGTLHFGLLADARPVARPRRARGGHRRVVRGAARSSRERADEAAGRRSDGLWEHGRVRARRRGARRASVSARRACSTCTSSASSALDPDLNAVCYLDADAARARAEEIDADVAAGRDPGPFAGVPIGVKELASGRRAGPRRTRRSSTRTNIADGDDTEVSRLRAAGAVIIGLTTASEHGTVELHEHAAARHHAQPVEPRAHARRVVGRLGGGGRRGAVPRVHRRRRWRLDPHPVVVLRAVRDEDHVRADRSRAASRSRRRSTSVRGPMVRSVRDAARYLDVTSGPTLTDPTSLPKPHRSLRGRAASRDAAVERLRGKRAAFSGVRRVRRRRAGGRRRTPRSSRTCSPTSPASSSSRASTSTSRARVPRGACSPRSTTWLARRRGERPARRAHAGAPAPAHVVHEPHSPRSLGKAIRRRHELLTVVAAIFEQVDLLLTPTTPTTAFAAEGMLSGAAQRGGGDLIEPVGAVHRAVQHDGPARGEHPGRSRRRDAGRAPGDRAAPSRHRLPRRRRAPRRRAPLAEARPVRVQLTRRR